jgi:hypothetical protein
LTKTIVEGFPWGQTINGVQWFSGLTDFHEQNVEVTNNTVKLHVEGDYAKITLEDLSQAYPLNGIIPQNRTHCSDMPFDIFCMPYSDDVNIIDGNTSIKSNIQINMSFAQGVALSVGTDSIYDVQILPFCPFPDIITGHKIINGSISSSDITQNSVVVGKIFWCPISQLSFDIDILYPSETEPIPKKVLTQTQFARIVAPNQSSFFDFNIQKNNGLSNIQVYCTFKPFTPWMKIVPQWDADGLYSTPNQLYDARGLLLAGDYSVAQATSAWANYELNNKNYLSIFDRQIQNLEFNRNVGLMGEGFGAVAGTVAGGVAGGVLGSMAGGIGAIPGAILGAAGGALTGGGDFAAEWLKQNEAIDYTKDLFEYQLGNIKALPQGLARTAAQNICNSYVPILEIWDTTEEEKLALSNKIKYNGMTVQRIDNLINYLPQGGYFQGQLVRLETVKDDFHIINALAKEIRLGFYLPDTTGE